MIRFYCLGSRSGGAAPSRTATCARVRRCTRAAALGHVDALRELGHCLQDGYGVRRDPAEGRRLLVAANARELTLALSVATASRHAVAAALPFAAAATRRHEFRRCSVCGAANYCSRTCQALDLKRAHKAQCVPMDRWLLGAVGGAAGGACGARPRAVAALSAGAHEIHVAGRRRRERGAEVRRPWWRWWREAGASVGS